MNKKLKDDITFYITGKRYLHTLSVERECANLAKLYSLNQKDTERLSISALLHDITKDKRTEEQIQMCQQYGVPVNEEDKLSPKIFHAKTASYLAREKYPYLVDEVIINCIRWHTTGRPAMSLLEKLLYLADYIEETRNYTECMELRNYFYSRIDTTDKMKLLNETLILSFDMTIRNLLDESSLINFETVNSRNYLLQEH